MEAKIPFYNIVNIFLPGLVLIGSCVMLFLDKIEDFAKQIAKLGSAGLEVVVTMALIAIAYEVGYIIFRLGSTIIEPILKKMFGWAEYSDFIAAGKVSAKAHDKLEMLSREYGFARTQIVLFIALSVLTGVNALITKIIAQWILCTVCVACVILFVLTARDHMIKIQEAVRQYLVVITSESTGNATG
jgi:hypothetical protein